MRNFCKVMLSLFLGLSITTTFANEKSKEDNSFWKQLDNFLADDKEEPKEKKEIIKYVKPKHSLNADMTQLLAYLKLAKSDVEIEKKVFDNSPPSYQIEIVSPIVIDGFGLSPERIDYYEVTFIYAEKYINVSASLASIMALHLGGVKKAPQYEKVIADLQNQVAKKMAKSIDSEIAVSKKYDGKEFILKFYPSTVYGVLSIKKAGK